MCVKVCKSTVIFASLVRVWASGDTTLPRTIWWNTQSNAVVEWINDGNNHSEMHWRCSKGNQDHKNIFKKLIYFYWNCLFILMILCVSHTQSYFISRETTPQARSNPHIKYYHSKRSILWKCTVGPMRFQLCSWMAPLFDQSTVWRHCLTIVFTIAFFIIIFILILHF